MSFKNCASFKKSSTEINNTFANEAKFLYIATPMYNLIEYSDNYRSGILGQEFYGSLKGMK